MDSDWTASALFSPSKARAQQAQAKDWAAVESWLAKRYGSRLPVFERNEETLQALLTLANLNETADEQRIQIERIEKIAFQTLSKRPGSIAEEILHAMQVELANEPHLDILAEVLVALDCPSADASRMGSCIIDLTSTKFETSQQLQRVEGQLDALKVEQRRAQKLLLELKSDYFQPPDDLAQSTTEWMRSAKHLRAKVAEYEERLSASRPPTATISIETVQRQLEDIIQQREQLAGLETELKAFEDLPTDAKVANAKLEEARNRLRSLMSKRERSFEALVQ